ncbi:hypothetical protein NPX13_g535 [Xylaria arbuscula]|uniref:Uncharacterized protein n=1 Tax=Xylaria arbuscula TaxID=114810 RepID=A0A9W8TQF7_9PEZI|nr:hypothetical protein NPX13_g535 [Xylaria arbuscula]
MDKTAKIAGSVTSTGFRGAPSVFGGMMHYGQSKLAAVLYAQELARRHPDIVSISVAPGIVSTELVSKQNAFHRTTIWLPAKITQGRLFLPQEAPASKLWCAVGPTSEIKQGAFYEHVGVLSKITTKYTMDEDLATKLWNWTEAELKAWLG